MIETGSLRKSVLLLNKIFMLLIVLDIGICWFAESYDFMLSSVILIIGLLLGGLLSRWSKLEYSVLMIALTFYVVGFYHVIVLDNYITCYFILLLAPILAMLLLENLYSKTLLVVASSLLFLLCNYLSGFELLDNYFFYYGLIPASLMMLDYSTKLESLNNENKKTLEKLKEKNEEILLFSNMMSHDLKAPLRSIEGFSSILQKRLPNIDERNQELFSYVIDGVKSMKKLIDDLLLYSKSSIDDYSFEELDLNQLIDNLLVSFNYDIHKSNVKININNLDIIYGHKNSLSLVFQNLISNSIKFQSKLENHIPQIDISQITSSQGYQIIISDNGIGIEAEKIEEIFIPFRRFHSSSQYEGTGLGMSIVSKVIEKHNGTIKVKSKIGEGTTFDILLPQRKIKQVNLKNQNNKQRFRRKHMIN